MLLLTRQAWTIKYFADASRPADLTVLRWLRDGKLPGKKIGGTWYIDEHAWLADGDELVRRVLEAS